jgi:hypothetical protein
MNLVTRSRIALAGLALVAVWPFAHRALVAQLHLDPWRYFGFAMYCYPKTDVSVGFFVPRGEELEAVPLSALPASMEAPLRRFRSERRARGSLPPDRIARQLRTSLGLDRLVVQVWTLYYDRATSTVRERMDEYLYPEEGSEPRLARGVPWARP